MAGYSGTPLSRKLGIVEEARVWLVGAPEGFEELLEPLPPAVEVLRDEADADLAVVFAREAVDMEVGFRTAMARIPADGAIWTAWPKRSSGVLTDITEDRLREMFLPTGMVDTKVAAIDQTWSGLRFVVRRENRAGWRER